MFKLYQVINRFRIIYPKVNEFFEPGVWLERFVLPLPNFHNNIALNRYEILYLNAPSIINSPFNFRANIAHCIIHQEKLFELCDESCNRRDLHNQKSVSHEPQVQQEIKFLLPQFEGCYNTAVQMWNWQFAFLNVRNLPLLVIWFFPHVLLKDWQLYHATCLLGMMCTCYRLTLSIYWM